LSSICEELVSSGALEAAAKHHLTFVLHMAHLGLYNHQAM
jgi:hypothetical protein